MKNPSLLPARSGPYTCSEKLHIWDRERVQTRDDMAQSVERLTQYLSVVSCFFEQVEQETLPSLFSTGWFQEQI